MTETMIHIVGHVGTDIDHREVGNGTHVSSFRLATTPRRYDRAKGGYIDGVTNWLTVQCWRNLAMNVLESLKRGDPVMVFGKLRTQEWVKDDQRHSRFVVEATAIGHDLSRGVAAFTKRARVIEAFSDHDQAALQAAQDVEDASATLPSSVDAFADESFVTAS
jgi:single-strand DNA-binding protein